MGVYDSEAFDHHDSVHFIERPDVGLRAIVAIHDLSRGPACGGTRRWVYESEQHATDDALRLARAMSYKNVLADLPVGGGKAVIMARPGQGKSAELLEAYGEAIESLSGRYVTTEDVGITCEDIAIVGRRTRHVVGLPDGPAASGDPSPFTAYGVFLGIRAALGRRYGNDSLEGRTVAIQGVGSVGLHLARLARDAGARLIVADVDPGKTAAAAAELEATICASEEIIAAEADVFAPCALGGVIGHETIGRLGAPIVVGGANNQLVDAETGARLQAAGILYAPDFVVNCGGIINVARELTGSYDPAGVRSHIERMPALLEEIFERSAREKVPTAAIAENLARERLGR